MIPEKYIREEVSIMVRKKTVNKTGSLCTQGQLAEEIRKKAQELYEKSGRKPGCDLDNWLAAEKIVRAQSCSSMEHMPC